MLTVRFRACDDFIGEMQRCSEIIEGRVVRVEVFEEEKALSDVRVIATAIVDKGYVLRLDINAGKAKSGRAAADGIRRKIKAAADYERLNCRAGIIENG